MEWIHGLKLSGYGNPEEIVVLSKREIWCAVVGGGLEVGGWIGDDRSRCLNDLMTRNAAHTLYKHEITWRAARFP